MNDTEERTSYRRSGAVAWGRFLPCALMTLLVAVVMALVLYIAFEAGWYYSIATPFATALPVLLAAYLAVAVGRCRHGLAAGVLSFVAGAVVILGYFHCDLVSLAGPWAVHRLDLIPRFIAHRMTNDSVEENGQVRPPDPIRNWLFLVVDSFVVCTIIAAPTMLRANRAYCETCGRWMRQISTAGPPGSGRLIANALEMEDLASLPPLATHKISLKDPCSMIKLEYCPNSRERVTPCRAFLTVTENLGGGLEQARTQQVLKQMEVKPDEVLLLADRVVALRPLVISAPDLQPTAQSGQPVAPLAVRSGVFAQIQRLPEEEWGLSPKVALARGLSLSLIPVVSFLGGVGLLVWGGLLAPWQAPANSLTGCLMLAAGAALAAFGAVVCWTNVDYFNFRDAQRRTRNIIAARTDAIVSPDDPQATIVSLVPRANWTGVVSDKSSDRGLLLVDLRRRQILLEGVKERVRIPAASLLSCDVEPINAQAGRWTLFVTVLKVGYPADGPRSISGGHHGDEWEIPLLPRPVEFRKYNFAWRLAAAESVRDRIRSLLGNA